MRLLRAFANNKTNHGHETAYARSFRIPLHSLLEEGAETEYSFCLLEVRTNKAAEYCVHLHSWDPQMKMPLDLAIFVSLKTDELKKDFGAFVVACFAGSRPTPTWMEHVTQLIQTFRVHSNVR